MERNYKLSVPVTWGDKDLAEITLRPATTLQIRKIGKLPYYFDEKMNVIMLTDVMAEYISECSALPPSVVNQLNAHDFQVIALSYLSFFQLPPQSQSK